MRTHLLVLGTASIALVGGLVVLSSDVRDEATASTRSRTGGRAAPAIATTEPSVGDARRYTTHAVYDVAISRASAPASTFGVQLDGTWELAIAQLDEDRIVLRGSFAASSMAVTSNGAAVHSRALVAALAEPHALELSRRGKLLAIHMRSERDGMVEGIVRSLAASLQVIDGDGATRWTTSETDAIGEFVATYERTNDAIDKTKVRYVTTGNAKVSQLASKTRIQLERNRPRRVDVDERLGLMASDMTMSSRSSIGLVLAGESTVSVRDFDLASLEPVGKRTTSRASDRQLLEGATLETLLAELAGSDEIGAVGEKLAALIRVDPAAAGDIAARFRRATDEKTSAVLLGALGAAGTSEAQTALVELLETKRWNVAATLAMVEHPQAELVDALTHQIDGEPGDLRSASSLALGTVAARLTATEPARAREIVDAILVRIAATTDPETVSELVGLLGNTGDVRALPALRTLLSSTSSRVRSAAVQALRGIIDPTVDGLIASTLLGDPDPAVRESAVVACGFRSIEAFVTTLDRATADHDERVRKMIVEVLGRNVQVATVSSLLQRIARLDPVVEIRNEAARLLTAA